MIERYSLPEMKNIWSDEFRFRTWLQIEVFACEARYNEGSIPAADFQEIKDKANFNVERILEIENEVNHDVIAFLTNVAEYVGPASRHIHFGMTSSDVLDTTLSYQMKCGSQILMDKLVTLERILKEKAIQYKRTYCIGRTHGIHAEPTTLGLKFLIWQQETKRNIGRLKSAIEEISVGMLSGAVGTFEHLDLSIEEFVCEKMGLKPALVTTQVIQRDRHANFLNTMAVIAGEMEKIALEIRHLQRTEVQEAQEGFSKNQKGSSAMPHKKNPIVCERLCGLARLVRGYAASTNENIALWHERDISHSSVERVVIPDSFIILDYMLHLTNKLITNLIVNEDKMLENLRLTRGLIYSQKVLLLLTAKGLEREEAYKIVQTAAMSVWNGKENTLLSELKKSEKVNSLISNEEFSKTFDESSLLSNLDKIYSRALKD